jgi:hypothetical protein
MQNESLDERKFKDLILEVDKLKQDIKSMTEAMTEIKLGQKTIEELLRALI